MFCRRKEFPETRDIIFEDGTLNQQYFQPKEIIQEPERLWTSEHRALLLKGIEQEGIGNFKKIQELLPEWVKFVNKSAQELRLKTARLIGRQNLQLYKDCKLSEEDILKEYQLNKEIGVELGQWKGVLVYDDDGKVLEAINERKRKR